MALKVIVCAVRALAVGLAARPAMPKMASANRANCVWMDRITGFPFCFSRLRVRFGFNFYCSFKAAHLHLDHGNGFVTQVDVVFFTDAAACGVDFPDQLAVQVVFEENVAARGGLLHALSQRVDGVLHGACRRHRAAHAPACVVDELVDAVVGGAAVGIDGIDQGLAAGDLL